MKMMKGTCYKTNKRLPLFCVSVSAALAQARFRFGALVCNFAPLWLSWLAVVRPDLMTFSFKAGIFAVLILSDTVYTSHCDFSPLWLFCLKIVLPNVHIQLSHNIWWSGCSESLLSVFSVSKYLISLEQLLSTLGSSSWRWLSVPDKSTGAPNSSLTGICSSVQPLNSTNSFITLILSLQNNTVRVGTSNT